MVEFLIFTAIAVILIIGFFLGKQINIRRAVLISKLLERVLDSEDQTYVWIGGFIGFKAVYRTPRFKKAEAVILLLPRHSLLYLPIALLINHSDRFYVYLYLDRPLNGSGHIVCRRYKHLLSDNDTLGMDVAEKSYCRRRFIIYTNPSGAEFIDRLFDRLKEFPIRRVSLDASTAIVTLYCDLCPSSVEPLLYTFIEFFS